MTDDEVREHSDMDQIQREALRLETLKKQKSDIEAEIADIEKYLDKAIDTSVMFDDEETNDSVLVTIVRGTVDHFDEHLISTRYRAVWMAVTKRVIDKQCYLDAVRSGAITPQMHAQFHHEMPKKAYVKITRHHRGDAA